MTNSPFSTAFGNAFDSLYEEGARQMEPVTGHSCKLYRNDGDVSTPVWVEINDIEDVSVGGMELNFAELKRRGSDWIKSVATVFSGIDVDFKLIHGLDETIFSALITAFLAKTSKEWLIADGDVATVGTQGLRLPACLSKFPWDQPLEEVTSHACGLKLVYKKDGTNEIDPSWMTVST